MWWRVKNKRDAAEQEWEQDELEGSLEPSKEEMLMAREDWDSTKESNQRIGLTPKALVVVVKQLQDQERVTLFDELGNWVKIKQHGYSNNQRETNKQTKKGLMAEKEYLVDMT